MPVTRVYKKIFAPPDFAPAANAIVIPATGWLSARFGRRRFFLVCTVLFTVSSFLSGIAPSLEFLVAMRIFQGLGGGPVIPMAQAVLWEVFPPRQRGMAMAVWGLGIVLVPTSGPTVGGWLAAHWPWRVLVHIILPFVVTHLSWEMWHAPINWR